MFTSARIKLTFWYLLIIMGISMSFSIFVYKQVIGEVRRGLRLHTIRMLPNKNFSVVPGNSSEQFSILSPSEQIDLLIYEEIRKRILLQLLLINAGIGVFSGVAGYFLAGKTLRPIERMVEAQKRFIADASHELRTPLTAMKTEIEVALQEKNIPQKEAKDLLMSNLEEIDRMQKLANYLLTLSRFQENSIALPTEIVTSKDVIETAVTRLEQLAKDKKITVHVPTKNMSFIGNSMSLIELVTILLDNAIKYSKPNSDVVIEVSKVKKMILLIVKDSGIGMKSSEIPYIFNRFYRADSSRNKARIDGYGLGLSIAKNIVDLHHGKIQVESEPNKGTSFSVWLPEKENFLSSISG